MARLEEERINYRKPIEKRDYDKEREDLVMKAEKGEISESEFYNQLKIIEVEEEMSKENPDEDIIASAVGGGGGEDKYISATLTKSLDVNEAAE